MNLILTRCDSVLPGSFIRLMLVGLIACASLHYSHAQSGYNYTYDTGVSLRFLSIDTDHNNLYLSGFYRREVSAYQSGFIASFDTLGGLRWWTEILDDSSSISAEKESGICIRQDHGVAIQFVYLYRPSIGMAILDSTGKVEYIIEYSEESGGISSRDIIEVPDGYLITGWTSKPPQFLTDAFILKTDRQGNQKWLRIYGHPVYEENSRTITMVDSNTYVISGTRYQSQQEPKFNHGWAFAIDSLGNKKWEWEADEEEIPNKGIGSMQYDSPHKEWIYVTFLERPTTYPGEDYDVLAPVLVRRDSMMNLISYQEYGPYAINHYMGVLEPSHDGGWVAAGSYTRTTDDFVSPIRSQSGRVMKLSNDGTLEWSVIDTAFYHSELGSRSYLSGVTESPSGSVYAVGWANNYDDNGVYRSFGWLLKITKDGCVDTLCTTISLLDQIKNPEVRVKAYPNPASDYLIVEIHEDIPDAEYIELFDPVGRLVMRTDAHAGVNVLSLQEAIGGLHVWRVSDSRHRILSSGMIVVQ